MGLGGKLVSQTSIKSDGNAFYELLRYKTHEISDICPEKIERVDLEHGQWGAVGSIISLQLAHDGKKVFAKDVVEAVDDDKKSITYNVIEGDLMEAYKTVKFIVDVEINGNQDSSVTWTIEYEKKSAAVPDPSSFINLGIDVTKDIERHHLLVPN